MLLSRRRILLIAGFGIPLVALISAVAIWGFSIEISYVLLESAASPPFKLLIALGTFLIGSLLAVGFAFGTRPPSLPVKGSLLLGLELLRGGLLPLMLAGNSVAILFAADQRVVFFSLSAWAALACLLGFFPATIAYALVYASQRRAAGMALGREQAPS